MTGHRKSELERLSAVERVPAELWRTIFSTVCLSTEYPIDIDYTNAFNANKLSALPLTISHVCSVWRAVIIEQPRLWASLSIELSGLSGHVLEAVRLLLKRSKGSLLTIRISARVETRKLHNQEIGGFEILLHEFSRCERLVLDTVDEELMVLAAYQFPKLRSIDIQTPLGIIQTPDNWLYRVFEHSPQLESVLVQTPYFVHMHTLPAFTFTSLAIQWLEADDLQSRSFSEALRCSPNLRSLRLGCVDGRFESHGAHENVHLTLNQLESLIIDNYHGDAAVINRRLLSTIFTIFITPSLTTLKLLCHDIASSQAWSPQLINFLDYCQKSLKTFSLSLKPCRGHLQQPLSALLERTPALTRFELLVAGRYGVQGDAKATYQRFVDHFVLSLLSDLADARTLLPNLQHLSIRADVSLGTDTVEKVVHLAVSRSTAPSSSLKTVRFVRILSNSNERLVPFSIQGGPAEEIEQLRGQGVDVNIGEPVRASDTPNFEEEETWTRFAGGVQSCQ